MTFKINHSKTISIPDGANNALLQPSDWNADLVTEMAEGKIIGRTTTGSGPVEEITIGTGLTLANGVLIASGGGGGSSSWNDITDKPAVIAAGATTDEAKVALKSFAGDFIIEDSQPYGEIMKNGYDFDYEKYVIDTDYVEDDGGGTLVKYSGSKIEIGSDIFGFRTFDYDGETKNDTSYLLNNSSSLEKSYTYSDPNNTAYWQFNRTSASLNYSFRNGSNYDTNNGYYFDTSEFNIERRVLAPGGQIVEGQIRITEAGLFLNGAIWPTYDSLAGDENKQKLVGHWPVLGANGTLSWSNAANLTFIYTDPDPEEVKWGSSMGFGYDSDQEQWAIIKASSFQEETANTNIFIDTDRFTMFADGQGFSSSYENLGNSATNYSQSYNFNYYSGILYFSASAEPSGAGDPVTDTRISQFSATKQVISFSNQYSDTADSTNRTASINLDGGNLYLNGVKFAPNPGGIGSLYGSSIVLDEIAGGFIYRDTRKVNWQDRSGSTTPANQIVYNPYYKTIVYTTTTDSAISIVNYGPDQYEAGHWFEVFNITTGNIPVNADTSVVINGSTAGTSYQVKPKGQAKFVCLDGPTDSWFAYGDVEAV